MCVIVRRGAESARVRTLSMLLCDFTAPASVCAFSGSDTHDMALAVPPIRVDTATDAGGGVVHVTEREVTILRGVELEMLGRGASGSGEPEQQDGDAGMSPACHNNGQAGPSRVVWERAKPAGSERSRAEESRVELRCGVTSKAGRGRAKRNEAERTRAAVRSAPMSLQWTRRRVVFSTLAALRRRTRSCPGDPSTGTLCRGKDMRGWWLPLLLTRRWRQRHGPLKRL